jgi:hypothetical protein
MTPPKIAAQEMRRCVCVPTEAIVSTVADGARGSSKVLVDNSFS